MSGAFARGAIRLRRQGYSPVPIRVGEKRPLMDGWHKLRTTAMPELEIARLARHSPLLGLGVAGGYGGLVPVDVDTDDPAIVDAVASVLPRPMVAKCGRRGFIIFVRSNGPIKARKFKTPKPHEEMLVEVLTTGQTLIPPTVHPDTRLPYQWLTAATLFDTPIDQLPEISPMALAALEEALAARLPRRRIYTSAEGGTASNRASATRMDQYARGALRSEADSLAAMPQNSGRNRALFDAGAKLGKFFHHRSVLALAEIESALLSAFQTNGLLKDDGLRKCKASLASGLRKAANDHLPSLRAYERRT
jgi:Bifunctional DNA primase/polymerase, N-terminal